MVLIDWEARQRQPKVHEVKTLGWDQDVEVKTILQRICTQVQPIMRKRDWVVPLVSEFYPGQANLLGLNIGGGNGHTKEIKIRVRRAGDKSHFLPEESLLGTLLHELVHNVRGPHDKVFYKLLDEITEECEDLMAKGITGTGSGFDGPSHGRLGSHAFIPQHNPPASQLKSKALEAAEARAKRLRLMPGVRKLGGGSAVDYRNLTPAQAAAAAAERRAADDLWCPCGKGEGETLVGEGETSGQAQRQQQGWQEGTRQQAQRPSVSHRQPPAVEAASKSQQEPKPAPQQQQQQQQTSLTKRQQTGTLQRRDPAMAAAAAAALARRSSGGSTSAAPVQQGRAGIGVPQPSKDRRQQPPLVIDLLSDDEDDGGLSGLVSRQADTGQGVSTTSRSGHDVAVDIGVPAAPVTACVPGTVAGKGPPQWSCPACTYLNIDVDVAASIELGLRVCQICMTAVPV